MTAEEMIAAEVARQDRMWGSLNERADTTLLQLQDAATAQLIGLMYKQEGDTAAFEPGSDAHAYYPVDWSGFRDYGSDIANLVVAASFITQEIRRLLRDGADTTRTSRNVETQPYAEDTTPAVIEA